MKKLKEKLKYGKKGITLIALVITIIVLLILAGVTIATLTGENGILTRATEASEQTEIASVKEQAQLDIANWTAERLENGEDATLNDEIIKEIIEENGYEKPYYTELTDNSLITENGYEILFSELYTKEETISYTNDGVPIPKNFYLVGGSKEDGVVISDNIDDSNKGTEHDTATMLKGNQFVWVCVEDGRLDITNYVEVNGVNSTDFEEIIPQDIINSIKKYKGFYIARFEASYDSGDKIENYKPLSKVSKNICNGTLNKQYLWNYCSWDEAYYASKNMYNNINNTVNSHLIYGAEWDEALEWIGHEYAINKTGYRNNTLSNTGEKSNTQIKNIYDLSGNCREWTQETLISDNNKSARRGGSYYHALGAGYRGYLEKNSNEDMMSFRIALTLR